MVSAVCYCLYDAGLDNNDESDNIARCIEYFQVYILRTVLTVVIVSEYAVSYAMCVVAVAGNLLYIIMYFYLRRRYKNVSGVT